MKDLISFIKKFFSLLFKGNFKALFIEPTDDGFMQFFRYIFVGGASFVTDYALLHLITEVGVYYLISGVISFLAGLWVNYALSKLLVFQKKTSGAEKAKEMFVFAVVAVTGLAMTEGLMWVFTEKLNWYYMISKAVAAIIVLFWNFFAKKLLRYRKESLLTPKVRRPRRKKASRESTTFRIKHFVPMSLRSMKK